MTQQTQAWWWQWLASALKASSAKGCCAAQLQCTHPSCNCWASHPRLCRHNCLLAAGNISPSHHACRAPESPKIAAMYSSGTSKSFTASSPAAHMAQLSAAAAAAADRHTEAAGPSPASVHYTSLTQFQNKVELYRGRSACILVLVRVQ